MAGQVVITDEAAVTVVDKYAEQMNIPKSEAGAKLIGIAKSRINALRKYAKKMSGEGEKAARKAKAKAPKAPKAPKKAKAE